MSERHVDVPSHSVAAAARYGDRVLPALLRALRAPASADVPRDKVRRELSLTLLPAITFTVLMGLTWHALTKPDIVTDTSALEQMGASFDSQRSGGLADTTSGQPASSSGLAEPPAAEGGLSEPPSGGLAEPPAASGLSEPPAAGGALAEPPKEEAVSAAKDAPSPAASPLDSAKTATEPVQAAAEPAKVPSAKADAAAKPAPDWERIPAPTAFWVVLGIGLAALAILYVLFDFVRLEIFKMLLASFFPLAVLILAVLGTIVFGLATPTEAAAVGSFGGFALAAIYALLAQPPEKRRRVLATWLPLWLLTSVSIVWFLLLQFEVLESGPPMLIGWVSIVAAALWCVIAVFQVDLQDTVKESVFLTAKTSAMVCWLFVGASIFSAAFALLGGQEIVEKWVLSLGLTPIQFMLLAQTIIFLLGWPLEWTEIIIIFMPIFIPLLAKFNIDPLFFGLLVALNLQTAFLSPPVAMAAFYLKGVSPRWVTLNQIFAGMMPFMAIQVFALFLLYMFPAIGLWLPHMLYK